MYALRHKPVPTPALAGNGPPSERGVVLLVALIILVALTLAGVALIRSVDTANIIAGNLSFRESAVHAGELGTQTAVTGCRTQQHNAAQRIGPMATRPSNRSRHRGYDEPWETFWNRVTTENGAQQMAVLAPATPYAT
jgi:type IV pilus assembly protein PilX